MYSVKKYIRGKREIKKREESIYNTLLHELELFKSNYKGNEAIAIYALADKIYHMCTNIGSPSSVEPMLKSIVSGKIKRWYKDYDGVIQVKTKYKNEINRKYAPNLRGDLIEGHFRWNFKGYKISRSARDYISRMLLQN